MIDYVIISKRWRSLVKNCRTCRSAELGNADHRLVCADLWLCLHAQWLKGKPVAADIGKLKEPDTRQKYSIEISNCFKALGSLNSSQRPGTDVPPDETFSPSEIGHTVKRLKNNKAAGICGLNSELLKYGGPAMLLFLHTLFSTIWQTEIIPEDWQKGVIIPLWKRKGLRSNCSNYRGITLLSVPGILFSMVLLDRCQSIIWKIRRPEQAGFMSDCSTIEQIFTIQQIVEKITEQAGFMSDCSTMWADFHDSTNSREDHRVPTESIYCLHWLPCCIRLSQSKSSLADPRVDWPTQEILQTSQGAAPWDGELCTSKWSAQPILSNYNRGAPWMCSGPRALQCHHRLHYDKNHFMSQLWAQIQRSYHHRCRFCRWLGHSGRLHGAAAGSAPNSARRGCQSRTAYKLEQN